MPIQEQTVDQQGVARLQHMWTWKTPNLSCPLSFSAYKTTQDLILIRNAGLVLGKFGIWRCNKPVFWLLPTTFRDQYSILQNSAIVLVNPLCLLRLIIDNYPGTQTIGQPCFWGKNRIYQPWGKNRPEHPFHVIIGFVKSNLLWLIIILNFWSQLSIVMVQSRFVVVKSQCFCWLQSPSFKDFDIHILITLFHGVTSELHHHFG